MRYDTRLRGWQSFSKATKSAFCWSKIFPSRDFILIEELKIWRRSETMHRVSLCLRTTLQQLQPGVCGFTNALNRTWSVQNETVWIRPIPDLGPLCPGCSQTSKWDSNARISDDDDRKQFPVRSINDQWHHRAQRYLLTVRDVITVRLWLPLYAVCSGEIFPLPRSAFEHNVEHTEVTPLGGLAFQLSCTLPINCWRHNCLECL